ncbi:MAG: L-erythro-3,5-diaminohexanoate dehydrogenase [Polyangiales bacterium]
MSPLQERPERKGQRFGVHRVLEPIGVLPQPALRLDNRFDARWDNEIVIEVETLNIDAASFHQMEGACEGDLDRVGAMVMETVRMRGKQHNTVTDSGGMLLGSVAHIGAMVQAPGLTVGARIATLVSLSLTPLAIERVHRLRRASAQIDVRGTAAIVSGAPFAELPSDLPERLSLAVFDVAGAPIQVSRRARIGDAVSILGAGGKSGILCAVEARRCVGSTGRVIGIEAHRPYADDLRALGVCDAVIDQDATDALAVYESVLGANGGREVDLAICCVNVQSAEMATILPVRDGGCAYFFSMSTSFTRAALGAEGVGKDVELIIGNGYARTHAAYALELVRSESALRALFERRYGG